MVEGGEKEQEGLSVRRMERVVGEITDIGGYMRKEKPSAMGTHRNQLK